MSNGIVSGICAPALVYLSFSLIQIIIDIYKTQFYTAFFKFWTMLVFTTLLNILCERGLEVVSWMFVFIPIITMTILLFVIIYFLGFNPGQINKKFNVKQSTPKPPEYNPNDVLNYKLNDIIKRELELQKKNDAVEKEEPPTVEEIVNIDEPFTSQKKQFLLY